MKVYTLYNRVNQTALTIKQLVNRYNALSCYNTYKGTILQNINSKNIYLGEDLSPSEIKREIESQKAPVAIIGIYVSKKEFTINQIKELL